MSVSGELICRLAERACASGSPDEALRLVRELREEIDAFERQQVARALTDGESLASVARSLGVTRQSAHRRFRSLMAPGSGPRPTPELRLAVEYARSEAPGAIGSEHLLLGILRAGDHPAITSLNRLGVHYHEARRALPAASRGDVKTVLCAAVEAARRQGTDQIGIEHVLDGALRDSAGGASATLRALGVTPAAALAAVRPRPAAAGARSSGAGSATPASARSRTPPRSPTA